LRAWRADFQRTRSSSTERLIASSTSAKVAVRGTACDRLASCEGQQDHLWRELMNARSSIEQILPVLSVCSGMDVDYQPSCVRQRLGSQARGDQPWMTRGWQAGPSKSPSQAPGWVVKPRSSCIVSRKPSRVGRGMRVFPDAPPSRSFQGGTQMSAEIRKDGSQPHHRSVADVSPCVGLPYDSKVGRTAGYGRDSLNQLDTSGSEGRCPKEGLRPPFRTWAIQVRSVVCLKSVHIGPSPRSCQGHLQWHLRFQFLFN